MKYYDAVEILNRHLFEGEKLSMLQKLAANSERYVGIFRPTKPKAKLIQNLLQSREIRYGDALEYLIRELIADIGFSNLPRKLTTNDGKALNIDQLFTDGKQYYFLEQKIRDDHDSSKKLGQVSNFEKKLDLLYDTHHSNLTGIMYFIDPSLSKNKYYYVEELDKLKATYNIDLFLFYGEEFFDYIGHSKLWKDITGWLEQWKNSLPDFPVINFDLSPNESFEEIKTLRPIHWERLLGNELIWNAGIIQELFSNGDTFKLLFSYFSQKQTQNYRIIAKSLLEKLNKYYY